MLSKSKEDLFPYTTIENAPDVDNLREAYDIGALSFANWILENGGRNSENEDWVLEYDPINEIIDPRRYTTEQLYKLYSQQTKTK